jgi:hypothetical protein
MTLQPLASGREGSGIFFSLSTTFLVASYYSQLLRGFKIVEARLGVGLPPICQLIFLSYLLTEYIGSLLSLLY